MPSKDMLELAEKTILSHVLEQQIRLQRAGYSDATISAYFGTDKNDDYDTCAYTTVQITGYGWYKHETKHSGILKLENDVSYVIENTPLLNYRTMLAKKVEHALNYLDNMEDLECLHETLKQLLKPEHYKLLSMYDKKDDDSFVSVGSSHMADRPKLDPIE